MEDEQTRTPEELANELNVLIAQLRKMGRSDLLLRAIGVPMLEELRLEAARIRLSRMLITKDYRFILVDYDNREVVLQPIHKAVYLLFLAHPEGIEFKRLSEYQDELRDYYRKTSMGMDEQKIEEGISRLVNPLDNAINEKCSRIKKTFLSMMDEYTANYYIISGHVKRHMEGSNKTWYERLKIITLPRELVLFNDDALNTTATGI
jgi:hypothetical protein